MSQLSSDGVVVVAVRDDDQREAARGRLASRTAMPGRVKRVGGAGGSAVRLPEYVSGRCAGGQDCGIPEFDDQIARAFQRGSGCRIEREHVDRGIVHQRERADPTPSEPSFASSGASTPGRLGGSWAKAAVAMANPSARKTAGPRRIGITPGGAILPIALRVVWRLKPRQAAKR